MKISKICLFIYLLTKVFFAGYQQSHKPIAVFKMWEIKQLLQFLGQPV